VAAAAAVAVDADEALVAEAAETLVRPGLMAQVAAAQCDLMTNPQVARDADEEAHADHPHEVS
jgi:hypothetical protein